MAIEDKLSRTTQLFHKMHEKPKRARPPKIPTQSEEDAKPDKPIQYRVNDTENLVEEISPRKIKVASKPSPEMYKRQHIFVEEEGCIEE